MKARLALAVGVPALALIFAGALAAGYFMGQTSFRPPVPSSGRVMPAIPSPTGGTPTGPEGSPPAGGQPGTAPASSADQPGAGEAPQNPPAGPLATSVPAPPAQPAAPPPPAAPPVTGPTTTPAIPAPPSRFHVQAGSFEDRGGALSLVQRLRDRGYAVTLVEGPPYRVWVGGYLDRVTAERLAANLQEAGFEATLTPR